MVDSGRPAIASVQSGFSRSSFSCRLFLRRFQASFRWFFFFLLFHTSMMLDLSVYVVDAHDVVVSEGHPVSLPEALFHFFFLLFFFSISIYLRRVLNQFWFKPVSKHFRKI
jgi:hypothetical protein